MGRRQRANISKEIWDAVKVAYLHGMGCKEIAERFKMEEKTVYTKVSKEGWNKIIKDSIKTVEPEPKALELAADVLEQEWRTKGAAHRAHVFKIAHEALKKSSLPAPRTWKDAQIADNMARKAVGLDEEKGATAVVQIGWMQQKVGAPVTRIENDVLDAEFEVHSVRESGDD